MIQVKRIRWMIIVERIRRDLHQSRLYPASIFHLSTAVSYFSCNQIPANSFRFVFACCCRWHVNDACERRCHVFPPSPIPSQKLWRKSPQRYCHRRWDRRRMRRIAVFSLSLSAFPSVCMYVCMCICLCVCVCQTINMHLYVCTCIDEQIGRCVGWRRRQWRNVAGKAVSDCMLPLQLWCSTGSSNDSSSNSSSSKRSLFVNCMQLAFVVLSFVALVGFQCMRNWSNFTKISELLPVVGEAWKYAS